MHLTNRRLFKVSVLNLIQLVGLCQRFLWYALVLCIYEQASASANDDFTESNGNYNFTEHFNLTHAHQVAYIHIRFGWQIQIEKC